MVRERDVFRKKKKEEGMHRRKKQYEERVCVIVLLIWHCEHVASCSTQQYNSRDPSAHC